MSKFLPRVSRTYEFEEDTVEVEFNRMTRGQMIKIMPLLPEAKEGEAVSQMTPEQAFRFLDAMAEIINVNTTVFHGLKDATDAEVTVEVAVKESYFSSLIMEIANDMVAESMLMGKPRSESDDSSTTESPAEVLPESATPSESVATSG